MTAGNRLLLYTTLPTPVLLPGESQGQGSVVGCRLWGRTGQTRLKRLSSSSYTTLGLILLSSQPETYTCLFYSTSPFNI